MSATETQERTPQDAFLEYNGETFGTAHGFDESTGDFRRGESGSMKDAVGPQMVANQLARTLKTPQGDDPLRPDFGLNKRELLGTSEARSKQAIIDAIGPEADPRVAQLGFGDIDISFPGGGRDAEITITATLADGTPIEFAAQFGDLLGVER